MSLKGFQHGSLLKETLYEKHRGTKGILLFFQKTRTLQSRGVVFHLFTIAIHGRNCFDSNIDLYCVIAVFNGTGDMFNR